MANRRFIDFPVATTVGANDIILIWQDGLNKQTTKATILSGLPEDLEDLADVNISGLTNGQILRYDSTTGKWVNADQANLDLADLNDVSIVSPSNGQVLVYNSTTGKWENSSAGFVPYIGAVTTVDLGAQQLKAGHTTLTTNGSTETLTVNHTSGSGIGVNITKGGNNEGLRVNKTSGSGNAATIIGTLEATTLVKTGGTAAQFLKANGSVDSNVYALNSALASYQLLADKGQPNGYASLDSNGKVPLVQINDALIGNVNFQGLWNAATNTPTLANPPAAGTKGYYYIVDTAGTFAGITFEVGDWIISNGSAWGKVDNTDAVSSVFGRTGNVTAANGDYTTAQVTESGNLYYTDARSRAALSFVAGSGGYNSSTGVITIPTNNNQITNGAGYITSAALSNYVQGSGTTNYLPKFNAGSTIQNSQIFDSGSFVGINTTTQPTNLTGSTLTIRASSTNGGQSAIAIQGFDSTTRWVINGQNGPDLYNFTLFSSTTGTTYIPRYTFTPDGLLGINNQNPISPLSFENTTGNKIDFFNNGTARYTAQINSSELRIYTTSSDDLISLYAGNVVGLVNKNGRIGIAKVDPSVALDVNGAGLFSSSVTASSIIRSGGTSSQFLKADGSVDSTSYVPTSRTITINGTTQDLSANRTYNVGTVTSVTATSPLFSSGGATPNITIQQASGSQSGFLSSTDWTTFNNKQNALTNPVTGTGTTNYLPKFTGSTTIGNSLVYDNGTSVGIGIPNPSSKLQIDNAIGSDVISISDGTGSVRMSIGQESGYTGNYINTRNIDMKFQTYAAGGSGGNIIFQTQNNGTSSVVERLRISPSGAATFNLGSGEMRLNRAGTSEFLKLNTYYILSDGNDQLLGSVTGATSIYAGNGVTPRVTITSSGTVLVNQTTLSAAGAGGKMQVATDLLTTGSLAGYFFENRSGGVTSNSNWYGWYATSSTVHLYNGSTNILSINGTNGATTFINNTRSQFDGGNGSAGPSTYNFVATTASTSSVTQATIGAVHSSDGYANLNLGSTISGQNIFWHISKRLVADGHQLEYYFYNGSGFSSKYIFATNGNFRATGSITTANLSSGSGSTARPFRIGSVNNESDKSFQGNVLYVEINGVVYRLMIAE